MKQRSIETMRTDGGCLVFDFINTVSTRMDKKHHEYLGSYEEFLRWCRKVELMDKREENELLQKSQKSAKHASEALKVIIKTREMLFAFFDKVTSHEKPEKEVLEQFNSVLSTALGNIRINEKLNRFVSLDPNDLTSPLNRILLSAYEVLLETPQERLKKCDACAWLFIDTTKNGKRRYCSPETCGSIEKAKRYYYRKKAEG